MTYRVNLFGLNLFLDTWRVQIFEAEHGNKVEYVKHRSTVFDCNRRQCHKYPFIDFKC